MSRCDGMRLVTAFHNEGVADYPLSCLHDKLDVQTPDEKEPQWQP